MIYFHNINPVLLDFGALKITWYGVSYLLSFAIGYFLALKWNEKNYKINVLAFDYIFWGVVLGGKMGYIVLYIPFNDYSFSTIFSLSGMSFHGGLVGVFVGIVLYAKIHLVSVEALCDFIAPIAPIGLFLGRIANFINGELVGRVTNQDFGVIFPNYDLQLRHPVQLYEALLEGLLLFVILLITRRYRKYPWVQSSIFIFGYAFFRFIAEFYREPDAQIGFIFNYFTFGQVLCLIMVLGNIYYLTYRYYAKLPSAT